MSYYDLFSEHLTLSPATKSESANTINFIEELSNEIDTAERYIGHVPPYS